MAEEILKFAGLTVSKDFVDDPRGYDTILNCSPDAMPDAIFGLSPLPSPLGEKLVKQFGYQLMELPMGESLAMRKPYFEDAVIPTDTYAAAPAVPPRQLHTVGVRGVLIAHRDVSGLAIERLLQVFYESDYARRANLKKMDPALLQRAGEYRIHYGANLYIHRGDPFHVNEILPKVQGFIGSFLSVFSAIVLAWQWVRRKKVDVGEYQQQCTNLDLDAQRAAFQGAFGEAELAASHHAVGPAQNRPVGTAPSGVHARDKAVVDAIAGSRACRSCLPGLVRTKIPPGDCSSTSPPRRTGRRKFGVR